MVNGEAVVIAQILRELSAQIEAAPYVLEGFAVRSGVSVTSNRSQGRNVKFTNSTRPVIHYSITIKGGGCADGRG